MSDLDLFLQIQFFARWLHILAGMAWLGLGAALLAWGPNPADGSAQSLQVRGRLLKGALAASLAALALGWTMLLLTYFFTPGVGWGPTDLLLTENGLTGKAGWLFAGLSLGHLMGFALWFIQWPCERRLLKAIPLDPASTRLLGARAQAVARLNAWLSPWLVFTMAAAAHLGAWSLMTLAGALILSALLGAAWRLRPAEARSGSGPGGETRHSSS